MALSVSDVRAIVTKVCARPDVLDACRRGDLGTVIAVLGRHKVTQGKISSLTGIPQGRLSEYKTGTRKPRASSTYRDFADGLGMPPAARTALGLDPEQSGSPLVDRQTSSTRLHMARADKLFKRLTAARLDNTLDYEYRRLTTVELLIIDDFALQPLTPAQTTDFYEIITERHRKASTVVTSNRDASEWLPLMTDPLLAQSAIDRLTSTCHELIVEGDSYRRRQRPRPQLTTPPRPHHDAHVTRPGGP